VEVPFLGGWTEAEDMGHCGADNKWDLGEDELEESQRRRHIVVLECSYALEVRNHDVVSNEGGRRYIFASGRYIYRFHVRGGA
jgi:hypothetical protein